MVRTDRKLSDSEKAMLLRLGHQSVSAAVALDWSSGQWRPDRPLAGPAEIGAVEHSEI
jgi:hypothetical protein